MIRTLILSLLLCSTALADTSVVSGSSDIHNNFIRTGTSYVTWNYGAHTFEYALGTGTGGANDKRRAMIRIVGSAIPAGNITDLSFDAAYVSSANFSRSMTMNWHEFESADADWADGTGNGSAEDGSPCSDYKAWSATTPTSWTGGIQMGSPGGGTLKTATAGSHTYGPYTIGSDVPFSVDLKHSSLVAGTDAQWGIKGNDESSSGYMVVGYPVDAASNQWTFTITYTPSAGSIMSPE